MTHKIIKQEVFKQHNSYTLFDSLAGYMNDGDYIKVAKHNTSWLNVRDTAINPQGWTNSEIRFTYERATDDYVMCFAFGKDNSMTDNETAKLFVQIEKNSVSITYNGETKQKSADIGIGRDLTISIKDGLIDVLGLQVSVSDDINGYTSIYCKEGHFYLTAFSIGSDILPCTEEEHNKKIIELRHKKLDENDKKLKALEVYLKEHSDVLPVIKGEIFVPNRLVNKGETQKIRFVCHNSVNVAICITDDCFSLNPRQETIPLNLNKCGDNYEMEIEYKFNIPGNTKIELWVNCERTVRQVAVLDKGYLAVIPWVGSNVPYLDEELHKYDIPGDYWGDGNVSIKKSIEGLVEKFPRYLKNHKKYGDRLVMFFNGDGFYDNSDTINLFGLDEESQRRGMQQIVDMMKIFGFYETELFASYTPDAHSINIMKDMGIKGLTSLCAWQNWNDGGWGINHCAVSNQPYYPADDDFRRSNKNGSLMCFTMGSTSCSRDYSIMAFDGCPTNVAPGQRYFENRIVHHSAQRYYDCFDGYINDSKNTDDLITVTVALEAFVGLTDSNCMNQMAIDYITRKAATEKIVFTSAADVSDYHNRNNLDMQKAYFYQPDWYTGYHHATTPGRIDDRIEADTPEYLAVVGHTDMIPMYFYDHTEPWDKDREYNTERNIFGLKEPRTDASRDSYPPQPNFKGVKMSKEIMGKNIKVSVEVPEDTKRTVTALFNLPYAEDVSFECGDKNIKLKKIINGFNGNVNVFVEINNLKKGANVYEIIANGEEREAVQNESIEKGIGLMWIGNHAYIRCMNKDEALEIKMYAPDDAYILQNTGHRIYPVNNTLSFTLNKTWHTEAPILFNCSKEIFDANTDKLEVKYIGETECNPWGGQGGPL